MIPVNARARFLTCRFEAASSSTFWSFRVLDTLSGTVA